jgi:hypothetical protein
MAPVMLLLSACSTDPTPGESDGVGVADSAIKCTKATDCAATGVCQSNGYCSTTPTCFDGVKNGTETGADCGGPCNVRCTVGAGCQSGHDCQSGVCSGRTQQCLAATCHDGYQNGTETARTGDCGGSCSTACVDGDLCNTLADCRPNPGSAPAAALAINNPVCSATVAGAAAYCRQPNGLCTNKKFEPLLGESDLDCGGACKPCNAGLHCNVDADCASKVCSVGVCEASSCQDGIRNGSETGIDCGGSCAPCGGGLACKVGADCASGTCTGGFCTGPLDPCSGVVCTPTNACHFAYCSAGTCQSRARACTNLGGGTACTQNSACASGVCDIAGTGNCCNAACTTGGACGATGCDTAGACVYPTTSTSCGAAQSCTNGVATSAATCNGTGACTTTTTNCGPIGCNTAGTACNPTPGTDCTQNSDCASGVCGANGTGKCCTAACTTGGACGTTGCDATGACVYPGTSQACAAPSCTNGVATSAGTCSGTGSCTTTTTACGASGCNIAGTACNPPATTCTTGATCPSGYCANGLCTNCVTGSDCASGYCNLNNNGGTCQPCGTGSDCASGVCNAGVCGPTACGASTSLYLCTNGRNCATGADCVSGVCSTGHICQAPTCTDGVRNGTETGLDCGGSCPNACSPCAQSQEYWNGGCWFITPSINVTVGALCAPHGGFDALHSSHLGHAGNLIPALNPSGTIGPYNTGSNIYPFESRDSLTHNCNGANGTVFLNTLCPAPMCGSTNQPWTSYQNQNAQIAVACMDNVSCADGVRNQGESDVDCGGPCTPCATRKTCNTWQDCQSGMCQGGVCTTGPNCVGQSTYPWANGCWYPAVSQHENCNSLCATHGGFDAAHAQYGGYLGIAGHFWPAGPGNGVGNVYSPGQYGMETCGPISLVNGQETCSSTNVVYYTANNVPLHGTETTDWGNPELQVCACNH